jgi:Dolichyl-phosphate-mannose-protein mannosyltransferase
VLSYPRWSLAIFVIIVFGLVTRGDFSNGDTPRRLQVTHWLWTDQPQLNDADRIVARHPTAHDLFHPGWCELEGKNGEVYAQFGLGQSLIMLPADVLSWWMVEKLLAKLIPPSKYVGNDPAARYSQLKTTIINLATFPPLCVASVILSFELLLLLGFSRSTAVGATILLVVATTFLVYVQNIQENGLMYLCYVAALFFVLRAPKQDDWKVNLTAAGVFSGFSLLIKISDVAYVGPVFLLALCLRFEPRKGREINFREVLRETGFVSLYYGSPLLLFFAIDRYYQFYRFGDLLSTYMKFCERFYAQMGDYPSNFPFGYDFLSGFFGPFLSPNYSIFLFDPFFIAAVTYMCFQWRKMFLRQKLVFLGACWALITLALTFAGTYFWTGGLEWGPRHHLVPVEVICLLGFAFVLREFGHFRPWIRTLLVLNLIVATGSQIIALPILASVEPGQIELGDHIGVAHLMRVRNLYHLAIGDFERVGLGYGSPAILMHVVDRDNDQILLLRLANTIPRLRFVFSAVFFILLASVSMAAALVVARTIRVKQRNGSAIDA